MYQRFHLLAPLIEDATALIIPHRTEASNRFQPGRRLMTQGWMSTVGRGTVTGVVRSSFTQ